MYYTTGFSRREIQDLCTLITQAYALVPAHERRDWPPILGLGSSVVITLTYLRRNRVQWELAETYGVSQSTISRAITVITPLLSRALARYVTTAEDLKPRCQYVVDGTLLPCWSWADRPGLRSGKHKTTGVNVQVVGTLDGELIWISDPIDGARHDVFCLDESGVLDTLDTLDPGDWTGDKGYVGRGMLTPFKKTGGEGLLNWQKEFNTAINKLRAVIERLIANFKTWRILHTDYRRPFDTFHTTISAVVGLHFYSLA
jgi:DDE superfamily endonuclease/Helix-turn-helix of DDE superfamily endonuclease